MFITNINAQLNLISFKYLLKNSLLYLAQTPTIKKHIVTITIKYVKYDFCITISGIKISIIIVSPDKKNGKNRSILFDFIFNFPSI